MKKLLLFSSFLLLSAGTALADVEVNETNFPDANFRSYLLSQSNGSEGVLTDEEIAGVTEINVGSKNISNLHGIEYFTLLTVLYCHNNQLTSLDVSKNTALTKLYCYNNQIKGKAMDALVASLPTVSLGTMRVIDYENEQNEITTTQVAAAKAKGWTPYYHKNGTKWKEYAGVDPSTGVNNVEASEADDSAPWYTVGGTRLQGKPTAAGIYIQGKKKILVK